MSDFETSVRLRARSCLLRRCLVISVAALVGAALGVPAPVTAGADAPPDNVPVTRADLNAYQDPWLTVDPGNPDLMAVAYREGNQRQVCGLALSRDGGRSWTSEDLIGPHGRLAWPQEFAVCFEAVIAFGPDGTLYYAVQAMRAFADPYSHVLVTTSTDGGVGFSPPASVDPAVPPSQGRAGGDWHPRVAVDASSGRVFVRWTRFAPNNRQGAVLVASSAGRGAPFSAPVNASPAPSAGAFAVNDAGASIAAGGGGSVYTSWLDLTRRAVGCIGRQPTQPAACSEPVPLYVAASHDGGRSFGAPVAVEPSLDYGCPGFDLRGTGRSACGPLHFDRGPEAFSLAIGTAPSSVFLAWWDGDPEGPTRSSFAASADGGLTWTAPRRLDGPAGRASDRQHRPQVTVSAAGRLDLTYYDAGPTGAQDVYWMHSEDGGAHFSAPVRVTDRSSSLDVGPIGEDGVHPGFGEWLGQASTDAEVLVAWTDTRRGNTDTAKQDVFFAAAQVGSAGRAAWVLPVAVGAALVAAALVTAGILRLRARRRRNR